jgi:hypothetical protein
MSAAKTLISQCTRATDTVLGSLWPIRRRLLGTLLVPLLLILTQQAAFVHELGHFVQQVQRTDGPDRQSDGSDFCEKCFVFAHLAGASPSAPPSVLPAPLANECPLGHRAVQTPAESTVCRIRGPPVYL